MSSELALSSCVSIARWGRTPIGFIAVMESPGKLPANDCRERQREHRLVVLPEYQGLGIGTKLSNVTGARWLAKGFRYNSKSASFVLRNYRRASPLWEEMADHHKNKATGLGGFKNVAKSANPRGKDMSKAAATPAKGEVKEQEGLFSFEYIGEEEEQLLAAHLARGLDASTFILPPPGERAAALEGAKAAAAANAGITDDEDDGADGAASVASSSSAGSRKRAGGGGGAGARGGKAKAPPPSKVPLAKKPKVSGASAASTASTGGIASFFKPPASTGAGRSTPASNPWAIAAGSSTTSPYTPPA